MTLLHLPQSCSILFEDNGALSFRCSARIDGKREVSRKAIKEPSGSSISRAHRHNPSYYIKQRRQCSHQVYQECKGGICQHQGSEKASYRIQHMNGVLLYNRQRALWRASQRWEQCEERHRNAIVLGVVCVCVCVRNVGGGKMVKVSQLEKEGFPSQYKDI